MQLVSILIPIHVALGATALVAGAIALSTTKGARWHRLSGKVFFYTMLVSAITACVVAMLPGHINYFLFAIGMFSSYFVLTGYRSLQYKKPPEDLMPDRIMAIALLILGVGMIIVPLLTLDGWNPVLTVFGGVGIIFGARDLRMIRHRDILQRRWLRLHLGKMIGGYIAATTAFFVVNEILPGIWNWFTPGIIGGIFIAYWSGRVRKKGVPASTA